MKLSKASASGAILVAALGTLAACGPDVVTHTERTTTTTTAPPLSTLPPTTSSTTTTTRTVQ